MNEFETMKYFMAAERISHLVFQLEMAIEFLEEYKIEPCDEVKEHLTPKLEKLLKWLK